MAMSVACIQPFLLSRALPNDLVVHEIFGRHLYKLNSPLSEKQRDSIQHFHFYFKKLLVLYYNHYDRRPNSDMYFLDILDNDLLVAINEGKPFLFQPSDYLKENPELVKLCMAPVTDRNFPDYIYSVWCYLSAEKKLQVYDFLVNRHIQETLAELAL